ncbi:MAG: head-tail connector protein [Rickettsiales bacterium]|jgi:hypothetical protein|nr:head-tail connector protein [Rickettsiales bacterium]
MNTKTESNINEIKNRFKKSLNQKQAIESLWNECRSYATPTPINNSVAIYDSTAIDAVDVLCSSLISEITPAWSKWFYLSLNANISALSDDEKSDFEMEILNTERVMQKHFSASNFQVELHQSYIDLVTTGNACLLFEENIIGASSAFKFTSIPVSELCVEENDNGKVDTIFRKSTTTISKALGLFPIAKISDEVKNFAVKNPDHKIGIIESVMPNKNEFGINGYKYIAFIEDNFNTFTKSDDTIILKEGIFTNNPFIYFRWSKIAGETYGKSPVMKALPDIKTANKIVELILKNASIAVSGMWQADDDGVINLDNIVLAPGMIIPKAIGSSGLTPLQTSSNFDVSQLVLTDIRANIKRAMLSDGILFATNKNMTATEVMERASDMEKILGATYGRLQYELLNPLIERAISILLRRGEIKNITIDSEIISVEYVSPIARAEHKREAANTIAWINSLALLGPDAMAFVNKKEVVKHLNDLLNMPDNLIINDSALSIDNNHVQAVNETEANNK